MATAAKSKASSRTTAVATVDPSIFAIQRDKLAFEQLIEESGRSLTDEANAAAATELAKEIADSEGKKLDGWIWWHEQTKAKAALLKSMKDLYAAKEKTAKDLIEWQKSVFFSHLKLSQVDEIVTPLQRKIYLHTNPSPAPVLLDAGTDEAKLPDSLTAFTLDIFDRDLLAAAVLSGQAPGVRMKRSANLEAFREVLEAREAIPEEELATLEPIPAKLGERGQHARVI